MKQPTLTPSWDLIGPNFTLIRQHYLPLIYLLVLPSLLYTFGSLLLGNLATPGGNDSLHLQLTDRHVWALGVVAAAGLWAAINLGPLTLLYVTATNGRSESLAWYYRHGLRHSLPLLGLVIVTALLIIGGLLLLIVPGFIAMRRYYLSPYHLVTQNCGIFQALDRSAKQSQPKHVRGAIWGVIGVQIVAALAASALGIIPLIGIIMTQLLSLSVVFLPALRFRELEATR